MTDPYATLGISKTATDKEIRSAYRRLAKQYHPDHNAGDIKAEERFKAVNTAYNILGDKEKRARFDRGEIDAEGQERGPFGGGNPFGGGAGGFRGQPGGGHPFGGGFSGGGFEGMSQEDLGDIFGMFSGGFSAGGRAGGRAMKGRDIEADVSLSFMESVLGTQREFRLDGGQATTIRIPPGVENGKNLRVRGKGEPGRGAGASAGDLLLRIHIATDPYYTREGQNLRVTQDVDLKTAILGGKVPVRTPKGTIALSIKPMSDSGTVMRIPGRGIAEHGKNPAGDLLVSLRLTLKNAPPDLADFLRREEADGASMAESTVKPDEAGTESDAAPKKAAPKRKTTRIAKK